MICSVPPDATDAISGFRWLLLKYLLCLLAQLSATCYCPVKHGLVQNLLQTLAHLYVLQLMQSLVCVSLLQNDLIAVPAGPGRSVAYTIGFSNVAKVQRTDIIKALFTKPKMVPLLLFR
jgi:hypothetical protein